MFNFYLTVFNLLINLVHIFSTKVMHLESIKQQLDSGDVKFLSESTGYSKEMIYKVLNGERNNEDIARAIKHLAEGKKSLREQISLIVNG